MSGFVACSVFHRFVNGEIVYDRFSSLRVVSVFRLLLTALTLAAKYYDDCYYANKRYAEIGGVCTRELNSLEAYFLDMIRRSRVQISVVSFFPSDYRLYVAPEEYIAYKEEVENVSKPLYAATCFVGENNTTFCSSSATSQMLA